MNDENKSANAEPKKVEPNEGIKYAGFWLRVFALLVDQIIIWAGIYIGVFIIGIVTVLLLPIDTQILQDIGREIDQINNNTLSFGDASLAAKILTFSQVILYVVVTLFYHATLEAGKMNGSLGKRLFKIKVMNEDLTPLTFRRAFFRNGMAWVYGILTLMIGHVFARFTAKKQAFHDLTAHTIVIKEA